MTRSNNVMPLVGGMVLIAVLGYFLFLAANTWGLTDQRGPALVLRKAHQPMSSGYTSQVVDRRLVTVPHTTGEAYVLMLQIGEERAVAVVAKELYDQISAGDEIRAVYQHRRITRTVR